MGKTLVAGVVLAVAAALIVGLSATFDLELESVALLGGALGAVIALVPDGSYLARVGGFLAGFVVAFIGYALRAAALPDTSAGRAVAVALVVLLCVAVVAVSRGQISLWSVLLGTAAVAGAYEFTYAAAPPQMPSTSIDTGTTLLFNVAVGFAAAAIFAPITRATASHAGGLFARRPADTGATHLNEMMEETR